MSPAPLPAEQLDHLGEELDVPAVVAGDADGAHVLLDRGADDVARGAVVAEVDHLDAVADQFEVDRVDGAVVPVADRDGGEDGGLARRRSRIVPISESAFGPQIITTLVVMLPPMLKVRYRRAPATLPRAGAVGELGVRLDHLPHAGRADRDGRRRSARRRG